MVSHYVVQIDASFIFNMEIPEKKEKKQNYFRTQNKGSSGNLVGLKNNK